MKTVYEIYYRAGKSSQYSKYNTDKEIVDFPAAVALRKAVSVLKGTKDVIVTNHTVRESSTGKPVVKQLANVYMK